MNFIQAQKNKLNEKKKLKNTEVSMKLLLMQQLGELLANQKEKEALQIEVLNYQKQFNEQFSIEDQKATLEKISEFMDHMKEGAP